MKNFFDWTKQNKLATFIIFGLLLILISKKGYAPFYKVSMGQRVTNPALTGVASDASYSTMEFAQGGRGGNIGIMPTPYWPSVPPANNVTDRKVITEGSLSLQVKNVSESIANIKAKVAELTGYVVNVYINRPEFGENATVSVRVPSGKVEEFMAFVKERSIKVVNENISGADITDQYVDAETRIAQLVEQRTMLEEILRSAQNVDEIMQVRPYIAEVQNEIDSLTGRMAYIDESAKTSVITVFLSTDELSLPYTPDLAWRPQVIYKNAVRSLLVNLQKLGSGLIWVGVYSVAVIPAVTLIAVIYMTKKRKHGQQ